MAIYIAQHKQYWIPNEGQYKAIEVGSELRENNFLECRDNIGDNISKRNPIWCELTALYWMFKHDDDSDFIGLCHYRRYFAFNIEQNKLASMYIRRRIRKGQDPSLPIEKACLEKKSIKNIIATDNIIEFLNDYNIVLPVPLQLKKTVREAYVEIHGEESLEETEKVIRSLYPDYWDAFSDIMNGKQIYLLNMFVMSNMMYKRYATWLFDILFEVEKNIKIPEDTYHKRIIGFLAERLLNVWVKKNNLKIKEIPILFIHDDGRAKYRFFSDIISLG